MLGPSFSPSIARIPGPTSSHSRHQRLRCRRAWCTRERSCERAVSSSVSSGGASSGERASLARAHRVSSPRVPMRAGAGERVELDAHRARELAADRVLALAEAHEQRPAERLALDAPRSGRRARCRARPGSAASAGRSPRRARSGPVARAAGSPCGRSRARRSRARRSGSGRRADRPSGRRASPRSAPRAPPRARARAPRPRRARDPTACRAPRRGIALEQAVVADHLERDARPVGRSGARRGRARASISPSSSSLLQHRRDRARRDPQALGERVRRDGLDRRAIRARRSPWSSPRRPVCAAAPWWPWK